MIRRHSILSALSFCINELDEVNNLIMNSDFDKSLSVNCIEAIDPLEHIYDVFIC